MRLKDPSQLSQRQFPLASLCHVTAKWFRSAVETNSTAGGRKYKGSASARVSGKKARKHGSRWTRAAALRLLLQFCPKLQYIIDSLVSVSPFEISDTAFHIHRHRISLSLSLFSLSLSLSLNFPTDLKLIESEVVVEED